MSTEPPIKVWNAARSEVLEPPNLNMPPAVRTRRASTVVPLPSAGGTPSDTIVPLSPFDTTWVALPPVCHVYFFPAASAAHHHQIPFSDIVRGLSSSLSAVLPAFHTLAGELAYTPELGLGTVTIVCGEDAGVTFVEAETDLDFATLAAVENDDDVDVDEDALSQLVPDIRRDELPAPMFAVQVTKLVGGIALGVALNHVATDGIGFFRFMEMWASASSAAATGASSGCTWTEPPLHDRRFVRFDGDQELACWLLREATPELPRIAPKQQGPTPQRQELRRTFTFSAHALRRLKQRLIVTAAGAGAGAAAAPPPSSFAALAAHAWVSFARASGFTDDAAPVSAMFLADCRARMSPRVPDAYAGNCVVTCVVALSGAELAGEDALARAFVAISDAVAEVKRDPLAGGDRWVVDRYSAAPPGREIVLAGSPWFLAYAADFGFGRPAMVERAALGEDGDMLIMAGREAGSVQVSVALAAGKMPAFRRMFAVKSGSNKAETLSME